MPTKFTKVGFENPDDLIASGPTMMVLVGLSYDTFPDPHLDTMTPPLYALIDTGASHTCVDKTLAIQLELPIRGKPFSIAGISGARDSQYAFGTDLYASIRRDAFRTVSCG